MQREFRCMYDVLRRFEERYGYLKKMGVSFEGIQMIDPIKRKHAIVLTRPFLFDCRLLPKRYEGIEIKVRIKGSLPKEFTTTNGYIFAPENFEKYVSKNIDSIRSHFEKPEMTKQEILDVLAFGNFEEHKRNAQRIMREKSRLQKSVKKQPEKLIKSI